MAIGLIAFLVCCSSACAGESLIYWWDQDFSGRISGDLGSATGTGTIAKANSREFGFRSSSKIFGMEFELGYIKLDNATTIDGTFNFGGVEFNTNSHLNFDVTIYELFPKINLAKLKDSSLKFIYGLKVLDVGATVTDTFVLGRTERFDETIFLPQVGFHGAVRLTDTIRIDGSYKWLDLEISDIDVRAVDMQLGLAYRMSDGGDAVLGYRKFEYNVARDAGSPVEQRLDLESAGLFFGLRTTF